MLGGALVIVAIGVAVGTVLVLLAGRAARELLFGVAPGDLPTLLLAIGLVAVVGTVAGLIPAHRASRIDPMEALRSE